MPNLEVGITMYTAGSSMYFPESILRVASCNLLFYTFNNVSVCAQFLPKVSVLNELRKCKGRM